MLNRRHLLKGAAAFAGTGLLTTPAILRAQGLEEIRVMTPFSYGSSFIEMLNATSGGHWAANGVTAVMEAGRGGSQTMQQLVAGQTDFIRISSIEQMRAIDATGADLVTFSTLYQASTFHVVSLNDKPINGAEDMAGKTIGLVSVGGSTEIFLDLMLDNVGVDKASVKREVTGDNPSALDVMQAGRIDAFMCSINVVVAMREMGAPVTIWSTDKYAPMPSQGYVALRSTLAEKGDLFVRVLKGLHASVTELMTEPTGPIFVRAAKDFEIPGYDDAERLTAIVKTTADELWLSQGSENLMRNVPDLWVKGLETLTKAKMVTNTDPNVYWTNEYIEKALA
jgi:NitT/TauT family transport system substrate-binding protein